MIINFRKIIVDNKTTNSDGINSDRHAKMFIIFYKYFDYFYCI